MKISRRGFLGVTPAAAAASCRAFSGVRSAPADDDPLGVRADFPVTREGIYLDSAYITPSPVQAVEAGRAFLEAKSRRPISLSDMLAKTGEVRRQFARLIKASPEEVGFLSATSEGENIVARALELRAGDNVVVDELHYETTYVLYRQLEKSAKIELRIAPHRDGAVGVKDYEPLVDRRTRLISIAWVSHRNGFRHDTHALAELAHAHGAYLYADAIQAIGMFPVDMAVDGVDFFACGTYKWLLAGFGVAPFYVRRSVLDRIPPDRFGALHVEKELGDFRYQIYTTARKYEYATLAFEPVYQLGAGLAYLEKIGVDRIERHSVALAAEVARGLRERGFRLFTPAGNASSIVSVYVRKNPEEVRKVLDQRRIKVTIRDGQLRISPALFNNASETRQFLDISEQLS
jgi:selenocysteine lyase/cysteine desulfurase